MAGAPIRAPFQPRSKSIAITNTSNLSNASAPTIAAPHPPLLRPDTPASTSSRTSSADAISDRSTLLFVRRTLCSNLSDKGRSSPAPIDEILPPLTSSNEVDLQLYAFIAIIIREFVNTWYARITPDQGFVEEVVQIIAHCTRALEERLRKVDLESLLFEELPDLLDAHVKIYRTAHYPLHPEPISADARQIYHSIWPFAPLSPVPVTGDPDSIKAQANNEAAYRQLTVYGVLAVLLPTEDLQNDCLTSLIGQIFSEMILGNGIGGKACEPWLLWEGITKIAEVIQARLPKSKAQVRIDRSNSEISRPNSLDMIGEGTKVFKLGQSMQKIFWLVIQYLFLAFAAIRILIIAIATSSSLPPRISQTRKPIATGSISSRDNSEPPINTEAISGSQSQPVKQPILRMKLWSCVSTLLDMDARMPWLNATFSLLQWGVITGPGRIGDTDGMIDKILSHQIQTHILDPSLIPLLLRNVRVALFPNNSLAPGRVPPSHAEVLLIRRACAEAILKLLPAKIWEAYFGLDAKGHSSKEEYHIREVEDVLDIFSDVYCNKHLLYSVVELIIIRLMPELAEKGIEELLQDRLN